MCGRLSVGAGDGMAMPWRCASGGKKNRSQYRGRLSPSRVVLCRRVRMWPRPGGVRAVLRSQRIRFLLVAARFSFEGERSAISADV